MKKTTIAILNWNGKKHLEEFLPSVIEHSNSEDVQIAVIDNGSKDDSVQFLKSQFPTVKIIILDENYGYAGGYNKGLEQIESEYFVLLNSDVEVTSNWLEPVIEFLDNNSEVCAAMPKIKSYVNKEYFEYAGAAGGFIDKYGYPFCRGRILSGLEKDNGQYDSIIDIFWASGACMFVRSEVFFKAGGFDGDFFAHMEEIDLCWRFKRLGYRIVNIPTSVVYHLGGGTLPINTPYKMYLNYRNNLIMLLKNIDTGRLIYILFFRLALDGVSALVFLCRGSFKFFFSVLRSHLHFYKNFFKTLRKRKEFRLKKNSKPNQVYNHSMVFNFLVRKKRIFTDYNL